MKLGFKGDNISEKLFLATGMMPELAIMPFFSMVIGNAVMTAQRLGIFSLLEENSYSSAEVAAKLQADEHGIRVLLESLTGFGYLERREGKFAISPTFRKSLNGKMAEAATAMMNFAPDVAKNFEKLDQAIISGQVDNFHFKPATESCWPNYLAFLKGVSGKPTKGLVTKVKFAEPPKRMLDIAGGPAQYSIAFCNQYQDLTAVILDLPEVIEEGEKEIKQAGLQNRITYISGDIFATSWGTGYDFALLSNILHALSSEQCQTIIQKTYASLAPGGMIISNDVDFPDQNETINMMAGWSSLLYFATTGGRTHPTATIKQWMLDAGFNDIKKTKINNAAVLTGKK